MCVGVDDFCYCSVDFTVEMSAPAITVDEGVGDATDFVCVNLDIAGPGMVECELTVTISPSDGTASAYNIILQLHYAILCTFTYNAYSKTAFYIVL